MKRGRREETNGAAKRVFVVDDHPITRHGLVELINHEPDLEVSGQAADARSARTEIAACVPDLVLVDLSLPDKSGLELIKEVNTHHPGLPVIGCVEATY